jgi:alpha-glucosidase
VATSDGRRSWWESGVIYQVYPRSFQDSNGDGIGDLAGIETRLDHLAWLGVDALWLSPIFPSPMADFGYDVSDYCDVDPIFGTLADLDRLVAACHERGLKVVLDYVPNHTSSEHPWFVASRSARDDPHRDWYLWADPVPDGGPPNNWLSVFGGSAWTWDEPTGQYYYHGFLAQQPDLNWRNPAVREAMYDVIRFWLERGIDGFRVDVLWHLIKDDRLRDNPPNPDWSANATRSYDSLLPVYSTDRSEVMHIVAEMRAVLDEYRDRLLIGEIYLPVERLVAYYGTDVRLGAHLPFNFQLVLLPWQADTIGAAILGYERALPATGRVAYRPGAGPSRRDAPAHAARHTHALLRRRDRDARRRHPGRAPAGSGSPRRPGVGPRSPADADALAGRSRRGFLDRASVAPDRR